MNPEAAILFLCFELILGILSTFVISRFTSIIPYTILLFLQGIIISIVHHYTTNDSNNDLLISILQWENINPELMLFVFIPPLLFSECMTLNLHYVKKVFFSSILLAIPGAAFSAWLLSYFIYGSLDYNWNITFCWIIGSILCATDPVSLVALMKSHVSTSSQMTLTYLVVGESLLNDGMALVLFEVTSTEQSDKSMNRVAYVTLYFVKVLICSPLIGIAIGWATVFMLKRINRRILNEDVVCQIIITMIAAYLSFYVAQYIAGVSGVISCCSAGVIIASLAPTLILNREAMDVIWNILEWTGNTLIFLLAGLIVGSKAFVNMSSQDLLSIVILYLGITVVRGLMMIICAPLVKLEIPQFSIRNCLFVSFAGLRGPMCLVLVLLLQNNVNRGDHQHSEFLKFPAEYIDKASIIICGVVTLTNLINGILSEFMLYSLGIIQKDIAGYEEVVLHYAAKRIKKNCFKLLQELKNEMPLYDIDMIYETCSVFEDFDLNEIKAELESDNISILESSLGHDDISMQMGSNILFNRDDIDNSPTGKASGHNGILSLDLDSPLVTPYSSPPQSKIKRLNNSYRHERNLSSELDDELIIKIRNVYLNYVRTNYIQQINSGRLLRGSSASLVLLNSIEVGLETVHVPGHQDWDAVSAYLNGTSILDNPKIRSMTNCSKFTTAVYNWLKECQDYEKIRICTSFILAHKNAFNKIPTYLGEHEYIDTPEEALVCRESLDIINSAKIFLSSMDKNILKKELSILISRSILFNQEDIITHYTEEGILTPKEAALLSKKIKDDFSKIEGLHYFTSVSEWISILQKVFVKPPEN